MEMERSMVHESDLNFKATELRLGLPGSDESHRNHKSNKRATPEVSEESRLSTGSCSISEVQNGNGDGALLSKTQVVGWPPVRSHRKNTLQRSRKPETEVTGSLVKVSVDGAAYLRKIDLKVYGSYSQLLKALEDMFKLTIGKYFEREGYNYNGSDYSPTYEDKDGDWMLVGDVPWEMFICSCKRLRIMKGSEDRN